MTGAATGRRAWRRSRAGRQKFAERGGSATLAGARLEHLRAGAGGVGEAVRDGGTHAGAAHPAGADRRAIRVAEGDPAALRLDQGLAPGLLLHGEPGHVGAGAADLGEHALVGLVEELVGALEILLRAEGDLGRRGRLGAVDRHRLGLGRSRDDGEAEKQRGGGETHRRAGVRTGRRGGLRRRTGRRRSRRGSRGRCR